MKQRTHRHKTVIDETKITSAEGMLRSVISEILGVWAPQDIGGTDPTVREIQQKLMGAAKPIMRSFVQGLRALEQRKVITTADRRAIASGFVAKVIERHGSAQ
jgi:hypothetical protein